MASTSSFTKRAPDRVTEELAVVLSEGRAFNFNELFVVLFENLKARYKSRGGEEMMRLRTYETLQALVKKGIVEKSGKSYKGNAVPLAALKAEMAEQHSAELVRVAKRETTSRSE